MRRSGLHIALTDHHSRRLWAASTKQVRSSRPHIEYAHAEIIAADGRWIGDETIQTVACDQASGTCAIDVPAPGFALVFLDNNALSDSEPTSTQTFPSTTCTAGAARCRSMGYHDPTSTGSPGLPGYGTKSSGVSSAGASPTKNTVAGDTSDAIDLKVSSGMSALFSLICTVAVAALF